MRWPWVSRKAYEDLLDRHGELAEASTGLLEENDGLRVLADFMASLGWVKIERHVYPDGKVSYRIEVDRYYDADKEDDDDGDPAVQPPTASG